VFLHPEQRKFSEGNFNGPARVGGSAGTGKTVVALHRAVFLARSNPNSRVLLSTFSDTLANALRGKLRRLIHNQPSLADQIEVLSMTSLAERLYRSTTGKKQLIEPQEVQNMVIQSAASTSHTFSRAFLLSEWEQIVDAWQLKDWEAYRDVQRLGRKIRLTETNRKVMWAIYQQVLKLMEEREAITYAGIFTELATLFSSGQRSPYDFVVVDEAQDINIPQLRLLAALCGNRPNSLFLAGDLGQRIFQQPFSWKSLGVDVRGRSKTLRINYRTSHQIRMQADKLLGPEISDVDGNSETRSGTISVFNGPKPEIRTFPTQGAEIDAVAEWLQKQLADGLEPEEIGVFVRSEGQLARAMVAIERNHLEYHQLDQKMDTAGKFINLATMHLAKGLEFRAVVVMCCDDEVIPLQERIETAGESSDLEEVYNTERHLLYVACTRARDRLLLTATKPGSEFLDDMK
jgi:superfamily I DNA/RNA helicase